MTHTPDPDIQALDEADRLIQVGLPGDGVVIAERVLLRAEASNNLPHMARCHTLISLGRHHLGDVKQSLISGYNAIDLYARLADTRDVRAEQTLLLARMATALADIADIPEATRLLEQAQTMIGAVEDPTVTVRVWANSALVLSVAEDFTRAASAASTAYAAAHALGTVEQARCRGDMLSHTLRLVASQLAVDANPQTLSTLEMCLREASEAEDTFVGTGQMVLSGEVLFECGKALIAAHDDRALGYLQQAADIARVHDEHNHPERLVWMARALHCAGDTAAAVAGYEKVLAAEDPVSSEEAHHQLATIAKAAGDFRGSLHHLKRHHHLMMTRISTQNDTRAQVLSIRMGTERARVQAQVMRLKTMELQGTLATVRSERDRLEAAAMEDPLTGLGNRRAFDDAVLRMSSQASVIMVDLDHFKQINDTYGHGIGDRVLVTVAMLLSENVRGGDVVCRFGGEEFVVLVNASVDVATSLARRLRAAVEGGAWFEVAPGLKVTGSLGVSPIVDGDVTAALERADTALYAAKSAGRNRVKVSSDSPTRELTAGSH